jgi:hypothetical protein
MQESAGAGPQETGSHVHAHTAVTTGQMRTVGQRRRDAEEKLEQHLEEARHKGHPEHGDPQEGSETE